MLTTPLLNTDKKDHIIDTAIELFAEKGFEGTSIRDLATSAGVNVAMVNYYFGSKYKLFEALVERKLSDVRTILDELRGNPDLSEIEKVDLVIESYVERFLTQPKFHQVLQQEMLVTKRHEMHERVTELFAKNTRDVAAIIEKGIRKKIFRKVDPEMTFATIVGTVAQVLKSKSLCNGLLNKPADFDPYTDKKFRTRILTHIKQLIHSHLLVNNDL